MDFRIDIHNGAPPLLLGMERVATRASLQHLRLSNNADEPESDFYASDGIILAFDSNDRVNFIELFRPSKVEFLSLDVFSVNLSTLLARIKDLGHEATLDLGCYRFLDLGISLYCPNRKLESISVFAPGYYDKVQS